METTHTHTNTWANWGSELWREHAPDTAAGVHTGCPEEEWEDLHFDMKERRRRVGGVSGLIHTPAGALRRRQDKIRHG